MVRDKIYVTLLSVGKAVAPQLFVLLVSLLVRCGMQGLIFSAQLIRQCIPASDVMNFISTAGTIILMSMILIALFIVVFNALGMISTLAMRVGEFFNERIRFVFELAAVYVLFLMNLQNAIDPQSTSCATVLPSKLYTEGPLLFRAVGEALKWLGLWSPTT